MGFPTANMHLGHCLAPAFGVYAVRVTILENDKPVGRHDGVANFGIRPMYQIEVPLMEAHLFDFDGDLYGKHLSVELIAYIRPGGEIRRSGGPDRPDRRRRRKPRGKSWPPPPRPPRWTALRRTVRSAGSCRNPSEIEAPAQDYRASLFLPATDFPMKAGLPEAEPKWLARWAEMDLYGKMRERARGRPLFILHDGPIYANGDIHSGTGLNHILKDFVVRSQGMLGKDAPYVPGWDCHGLPIEWKVEEQYRAEGRSKDEVPTDELRRDCRVFASHWLKVQREQIKRLGQIGDFERPYTTMNFRAEAVIAREAMKFVENGLLYRGFRPVMWSPVEKTALADAEVEYHEKSSPAIYVKFPVIGRRAWKGGFVVIWTTTPWTIPGNRAIAYSPEISYGLYEIADAADGAWRGRASKSCWPMRWPRLRRKHAKMMLSRLRTVEKPELASLVCKPSLARSGL